MADFLLNDPAFYVGEPFDAYRRLRDDSPVHWCSSGGFWALTRHEDVTAVSRDPLRFCNGQGMTMRGSELEDVKGGETLITMDPPEHTRLRRMVSRCFTQVATARLEPHVRDIAVGILADVPRGEQIDFVDTIAAKLPVIVIAELMGVPVVDRDKFVAWSNASIGTADPEYAHLREAAMLEQYQYFEQMIEVRRADPRDDLLSSLVRAEGVGELSHSDVMTMCFLLMAAGNETTRNLISHSFVTLVRHPDQLAWLRQGGDVRQAVEELLRWISPVIHMARTVTSQCELRGQRLRAGEQVVMIYGAANHDERVFGDDADDLVLNRTPNPHLTFGLGVHFCLGSALARLEARVLLEEMVNRFEGWQVLGPAQPLRSTMIRGIKHLPAVL